MKEPGLPDNFDWDKGNEEHIRVQHGLEPHEAEEALNDPNRITRPAAADRGEPRAGIIGVTNSGRLLAVFYTIREGRIRVVTARPARRKEAGDYLAAYLESHQ